MVTSNPSALFFRVLLVLLLVLPVLWIAGESVAHAHRANVFAYVEGDHIVAEGYFSKSVKALDCRVVLRTEDGGIIAEGTTDAKGIVRFDMADLKPISAPVVVELDAGSGHKAVFTVRQEDFPESVLASSAGKSGNTASEHPPQTPAKQSAPNGRPSSVDAKEQARILDDVLKRRLEPVIEKLGSLERRMLEAQQSGPTVRDIVGGIGWVFGIFGVWAYFRSRSNGNP